MWEVSGMVQAMNETRREVNSARPNAPVVTPRQRGQGRGDPFRLGAAALLRRLADRVEPRRRQPCSTAAA
ncbi:hypothetical protein O7635_23360 [Asanoa sp. WMMD1127]|uniref:hypothetical protein n=1 Tax=Asanoa sp. WMMD1127 TaxID=3016107 RepID=UPI002416088F|nr:hypothetical protein [Asanoa sp. WMMD1127]MDG4824800.1 hypothetical protein [Asanoa sp. WMMD1127]